MHIYVYMHHILALVREKQSPYVAKIANLGILSSTILNIELKLSTQLVASIERFILKILLFFLNSTHFPLIP